MRIRTIAFFLTALFCLGLTACQEILFAKKAKGRNPLELVGDYYFHANEGASNEVHGLAQIIHLGNSQYSFSIEGEEVFEVEIVARGNDYFVNRPDTSREGYWHISTFRLVGDSAYNLGSALAEPGFQEDAIEVEKYFKRYELEVNAEDDEDSTYIVNNRRREIYKAFAALNDEAVVEGDGVVLQKLFETELEETGPAERLGPSLRIGPNPFVDQLHIQLPEASRSRLTLLSIDGKILQHAQFEDLTYDWSLSNLASGIYILRWEDLNTGKSESFRVVRQ
ncbi:MAG: T9SS type A sorting domain-containing protein [Bacteroidia bacterium]